jgi:HSP20 family protein
MSVRRPAMARNPLIPFGFGGADPILSLHREMNRLFDDVFRGAPGGRNVPQDQASSAPAIFNASMNVSETDRELRVSVELPGVAEQDIDIKLNDEVLTVRGEKKFEAERGGGDKENFHYVERSYGSFQRSLRLPFAASPDEVRASFENGVLTITVPKSAQQERSRRIAIQGANNRPSQSEIQQDETNQQPSISGNIGGSGPAGEQQPATH